MFEAIMQNCVSRALERKVPWYTSAAMTSCVLCALFAMELKKSALFFCIAVKSSRGRKVFLWHCTIALEILLYCSLKWEKSFYEKFPLTFWNVNIKICLPLLNFSFETLHLTSKNFPRLDFFINQNLKKAFKGLNWKITKSFFPLKFFV